MFKKILCPVDLSERSELALEKSVELAHSFGSELVVLNVHPEFMNKTEMEMLRTSVTKMLDEFKHTAEKIKSRLKQLLHEMHGDDVEMKIILHEGKPEQIIPLIAEQMDVELIVMATDGRDNLVDWVTGTISEQVVSSAKCPVMVIPVK